jgi:putative oxidoreductase
MISLLRIILGGLFVGHGSQKLFGWFGGHGPDGTGQFFESLGLAPGKRNAVAAGLSEAGGGALLAVGGAATPLGAAAISGAMITAVKTVHLTKGPWVTEGGYEYNLLILLAVLAITDEESGPALALAQLLAGAAGSAATLALAAREAQRAQSAPA